jgi:hypothetical protein
MTKHLQIRYFFITDRVKKGNLTINWCPTREMIGDYMTKPLQGATFRKFRDLIMGVKSTTDGLVCHGGNNKSVLGSDRDGIG